MTRLRKTSDGRMPIKATLLAEKQKGAVSITVSSTEGWRKGKRQDFTLCKYDTDKKVVPGSVTAWTGVPGDNNTIDSLELVGGNDQLYPIGSSVVAGPTSKWADDLIDAMLEHHDEEGRLKEKTVALNNINGGPSAGVLKVDDNGTVTSGKIKASNIDLTSLNKYSTEERVVGEWIDGRSVYQKTLDVIVDFKQNEYTNVPHGISDITSSFVIVSAQVSAAISRTTGAVDRLIPRIEWQHQAGLIAVEKDSLVFAGSYPWGRSRVIATLCYVK